MKKIWMMLCIAALVGVLLGACGGKEGAQTEKETMPMAADGGEETLSSQTPGESRQLPESEAETLHKADDKKTDEQLCQEAAEAFVTNMVEGNWELMAENTPEATITDWMNANDVGKEDALTQIAELYEQNCPMKGNVKSWRVVKVTELDQETRDSYDDALSISEGYDVTVEYVDDSDAVKTCSIFSMCVDDTWIAGYGRN